MIAMMSLQDVGPESFEELRDTPSDAPTTGIGNAYNLHMGSPFERWVTLRNDVEEVRLDFIRTDLQVCLTLTSVAETHCDSGNREHAARTIAKVEKGYATLLRFFSQAKGLTPEVEREFQSKFQHLRERLDGLQRRR